MPKTDRAALAARVAERLRRAASFLDREPRQVRLHITGLTAYLIDNTARLEWRQLSALSTPEAQREMIQDLDNIMEFCASARGYFNAANGAAITEREHARALRGSNRLVAKVRKALGYAYPRQDRSF